LEIARSDKLTETSEYLVSRLRLEPENF